MAWEAAMSSFAALRATRYEAWPRCRHALWFHPAEPRRGLHPRHRAVGGARLGRAGRRFHRGLQAAELLPPPVRRGRPLGGLRAAVLARAADPRTRAGAGVRAPGACRAAAPPRAILAAADARHAPRGGAAGARHAR